MEPWRPADGAAVPCELLFSFLICLQISLPLDIVHMADVCRGQEGRLTAKFCLPPELCREGFAGGFSQQRRCRRELTDLCREEPAHGNVVVSLVVVVNLL
jgi:hypothetical protein